jgi:hypothetical protein
MIVRYFTYTSRARLKNIFLMSYHPKRFETFTLSPDLQIIMRTLLQELQNHEKAWPFLHPVNEVDAPGYFDVIDKPMDLGTIQGQLDSYGAC